ncbi:hypothetical protein PILCRDRAFT_425123 [Piloderma croceum F 1598]|uniref:Uncharacterized protein n=1 Tax=Piloderma croceum (strain F 1598) TaxID=765440 RepID=A0A0C3FI20_PILCF|nr:hypothetical protein PILCRDRAFT_425123 [Piloderma croceum F 1598]
MGQKTQNRAAMARFWAAVGLQEVERGRMGVRWYGGWWWVCIPADLEPLLLLLSFSIHFLPLSTHS